MTYKDAIIDLKLYAKNSWGGLQKSFELAIDAMEKQSANDIKFVDKEDLIFLLTMCCGYIDDELGGIENDSVNSKRFNSLLKKYNITMNELDSYWGI